MLVASASAVLAVPTAAADPVAVPRCQQAGPCVVVQILDGEQVTSTSYFYADEVVGDRADIPNASYPVGGGGADAVVQPGSSLRRLVTLAGADPDQAPYAEVVSQDAYGRHLLSGQELGPASSNGFEGELLPAFYSTSQGFFSYVRPQREPGEANGAVGPDQGTLNTTQGGAMLVRVHLTGEILAFRVTATPVDSSRRTFTLSTDVAGAGFTFDWFLPGRGRSTEATPTYTLPEDEVGGTYPVTVGVERAADGSFGWGTADVQVGPAPTVPPSPSPSTKPGTGGSGPKDQGPTKAPSGSPEADPQPDPDPGSGGEATAVPTLPEPSVPTFPTETPADVPTEPQPTPTEPAPEPEPSGDDVTGILLTAAQVQAGGAVTADAPKPSQAARPLADAPLRVSTGVWAGSGVLLLLLVGAGSESVRVRRWVRRRWSRMSA